FQPINTCISEIKMQIFNRWGSLIFTTNNFNDKWDGMYKNEPQELGVYVYYISAKSNNGRTITLKGNVTLIR
ncbi:MAG: hypothetical protein RIQ33_2378, partial [Bacteroidota bacterium]